jgi:hypothetical protein
MSGSSIVSTLGSGQLMTVLIVMAAMLVPLAGIVFTSLQAILIRRYDTLLKRAMVERGMSAEEIRGVFQAEDGGQSPACASEVLVEKDGEWREALALRMAGDRYYVHFVGTDMSDNEWVDLHHVRFAAGALHDGFHSTPFPNGVPEKGPIEAEL